MNLCKNIKLIKNRQKEFGKENGKWEKGRKIWSNILNEKKMIGKMTEKNGKPR